MKYRIKFRIEVAIKQRRDGVNGVDLQKIATLPFLPRVGDMIAPHDRDEFYEVESFYWSAAEGFIAYFKFEDKEWRARQMIKNEGWKDTAK